jgi:hypothetical protein
MAVAWMRLDESYKSAEQFTQEQMQDVLRVNKIQTQESDKAAQVLHTIADQDR